MELALRFYIQVVKKRLIKSIFNTVKFRRARKLLSLSCVLLLSHYTNAQSDSQDRLHISIHDGWRFMRYDTEPDKLIYDVRPAVTDRNDNVVADTKPTESIAITSENDVLKKWILPSANDFISDPSKLHQLPTGNPGTDFPAVKNDFNDNDWEKVNLPHDWAVTSPGFKSNMVEIKCK